MSIYLKSILLNNFLGNFSDTIFYTGQLAIEFILIWLSIYVLKELGKQDLFIFKKKQNYGVAYKSTKYNTGYSVKLSNGTDELILRLMNSGSGGRKKPYYRISTSRKGALTSSGIPSSDQSLTHIDLKSDSVEQIKNIMNAFLHGG